MLAVEASLMVENQYYSLPTQRSEQVYYFAKAKELKQL